MYQLFALSSSVGAGSEGKEAFTDVNRIVASVDMGGRSKRGGLSAADLINGAALPLSSYVDFILEDDQKTSKDKTKDIRGGGGSSKNNSKATSDD